MPKPKLELLRLAAQRITGHRQALTSPVDVCRYMLALQGQDLAGAKWAIGVRAPGVTLADVDAALEARAIVRSWPMRGTLHLLAAEDLQWMLALGTPGVLAATARRRGELGLDDKTLGRAREAIVRALEGGKRASRQALIAVLDRAKLDGSDPSRAYHTFFYLAQTGTLVMGPCDGAEQHYVLVAEWIREHRKLDRDAALAELVRRYFIGHGPATVADLVRWVKLPQKTLKVGLELAKPALAELVVAGTTYYLDPAVAALAPAKPPALLLPGFDELILGYADRTMTIDKAHEDHIVPGGNGVFLATVVVGGRAVGTWKRSAKVKEVVVELRPFDKQLKLPSLAAAASAYARFLGKPVRLA